MPIIDDGIQETVVTNIIDDGVSTVTSSDVAGIAGMRLVVTMATPNGNTPNQPTTSIVIT